jgi:hypothetical protein
MDQYREITTNMVLKDTAHKAIEYVMDRRNLPLPKGVDVFMCSWRPEDLVLRVGIGGDDIAAFVTSMTAALQTQVGKVPDTNTSKAQPSDMNIYCRVVTSKDVKAGITTGT